MRETPSVRLEATISERQVYHLRLINLLVTTLTLHCCFGGSLAMRLKTFGRAILCLVCLASPAAAGTVTDTFDVTLTIQAGCEVSAPNNLNFGTVTFLDTALTGTVTFSVRCTSGTNGTISLNGGIGSSGTVATRTMESGANSVNYSLYMNNSYATIWGDGTSGTSTYP